MADAYFGIRSIINPNGVSVKSTLTAAGQGVEGLMASTAGVLSVIQEGGLGVNSPISAIGQGANSIITAT